MNQENESVFHRWRKIWPKMGVDIHLLKGTGPRGRIIARDVESAAEQASKPNS
jgi:pyruvate/2-oxoglutarate dehydrogenase complex dihydrolipoamide acyltransferase (E2) component